MFPVNLLSRTHPFKDQRTRRLHTQNTLLHREVRGNMSAKVTFRMRLNIHDGGSLPAQHASRRTPGSDGIISRPVCLPRRENEIIVAAVARPEVFFFFF